ncbi:MAG: hypothetical protein UV90_C0010G0005 [candidate division WWE3 bacterium GW2011_GWA2_43_24]|nr:MAG: hypothetical protein UV90_C0010G0005 [candidate division WWE3 bacterium GW2011_GWA2_43_24]
MKQNIVDVVKIRQDFPLFEKGEIYFDNACQSLRPRQVIDAVNEYYNEYPACGGRSMHHLAEKVTYKCEEARTIIANFLHAKRKDEIIFTRNTTEGINLVAHSLGLKRGDVVITSDKEHNSNLIPWQVLKEKFGIEHKIIFSKVDSTFDLEAYQQALNNNVKLVSLGLTSNLDGVTIPAKKIIQLAHKAGALVLLDGAQAVPHHRIDVQDLDIDFLAFSGHKMLGPSGTGVLYGKYTLLDKLEPFMVGGDTVASSTYETHEFLPPPEKFEAGLQDYAGVIGLGAAVKYLSKIGFDFIEQQEQALNKYITEELKSITNLVIIGPNNPAQRGGIISFYIPGKDHHQIALMLDETAKIMVRSGQHCVHSWFQAKNIPGSVRASVYFYNTMEEAEMFVRELKKIVSIL